MFILILTLCFCSLFQSSLCFLRHHAYTSQTITSQKNTICDAKEALDDALVTADKVSKQMEDEVKKLKESAYQCEAAQIVADEEVRKERKDPEEARLAEVKAKKAAEEKVSNVPWSEASIAAELKYMITTTVVEVSPPTAVLVEVAAERIPEGVVPSIEDA